MLSQFNSYYADYKPQGNAPPSTEDFFLLSHQLSVEFNPHGSTFLFTIRNFFIQLAVFTFSDLIIAIYSYYVHVMYLVTIHRFDR